MVWNRYLIACMRGSIADRRAVRPVPIRLMVPVILLLVCHSVVGQDGGTANPSGGVGASLHTQYLWRGRDYTFADAPVAVLTARGRYLLPSPTEWLDQPRVDASLATINPILRRGDPYQTALADTVRATGSAYTSFFGTPSAPGWLGVQIGIDVSFFYGAATTQGAGYGSLRLEPFVSVGLPQVYGSPRWSAVIDLTPDQMGWRGGLEWFPSFDVPWGTVTGYVGAFRPHNYLKQSSDSFLGRLVEGEPLLALGALIPSDFTVGAASVIPVSSTLYLQPEIELLVVPNLAQNPSQIVPAASLTLFYGAPTGVPQVHEGR